MSPRNALALASIALALAAPAVAAPPNLVLFVVDDQGRDAGCYGGPAKTPNLDRLAAEGTLFDLAFCTTASCSASRSVLLTGLYNHANGQYGHEHSYHHFRTFAETKSLPARLSEAGYRTCRIGKFHVGPAEVYPFDEALPGNARSPVEMAEKCRPLLERRDRPFFLYFCTADPHRSGDVADDVPQRPDRFGNRPKGYPGVEPVVYRPDEIPVPAFLPDNPECRAELAQYCQAVSRIDQGLGRLVALLRETGQYDRTLIVFLSDNGIAFPGAKTTLYEPGMRLPCVARMPGRRGGVVSQALINWTDIAPTLLEAAGAPAPKDRLHGRSFLGIFDQAEPKGWDETFASHTFHEITMYYPMRVVRTRKHKLIWNLASGLSYPFASDLWESPTWQSVRKGGQKVYGRRTVEAFLQRPRFELYDLEADPHEVRNLAADPAQGPLLDELKRKLRDFQKRTADPWIVKWEHE